MADRSPTTELAPVPTYGPLVGFLLRVRELCNTGRLRQALIEIDIYEWAADAFGDRTTVEHMIQRRMYTYYHLRQYEPALAVGEQLLERRRARGDVVGEAKTLADLAEMCILTGRLTDGMRYLARSGLLLEATTLRNRGYLSAVASYGDAAMAAGLYETAAAFYDRYHASRGSDAEAYFESVYTALLVSWGLWLDHLGCDLEARQRLRRAAVVAENWLTAFGDRAAAADVRLLSGVRALCLAKLGDVDRAYAIARPLVTSAGAESALHNPWRAHLALGTVLRVRHDYAAARRELLAAQHLVVSDCTAGDLLLVQHELATLNADVLGRDACTDLLAGMAAQARRIWRQRSQRLAMLRQARQREELEIEHRHTNAALLTDPLTGLGNRRQFDQVALAVGAGAVPVPVSLLIIDVDNFKDINDTYSHSVGDRVLREIASVIAGQCRAGMDTPIRYAGDEFTVFLSANLAGAVGVAERIRAGIAAADFGRVAGGLAVSVSTGVATLRAGMSVADLFQAADAKLYQAKRTGRDRVAA